MRLLPYRDYNDRTLRFAEKLFWRSSGASRVFIFKMLNAYWLAFAVGGEIIDLVGQTGPVAKVVLLILLVFSLVSWAIILSKWSLLRRARVQSGRFVRAFRKAQRLQDVAAVAEQFRPSPLVGVFEGGFEEYSRQVRWPTA